jgi:3-oxoacyl-[acyl-carrier-protein] synthase II
MSGESAAITGLGAVSGFGWGVEPLWRGLSAGRTAIRPFDRFDHSAHRTHLASAVPDAEEATGRGSRRLSFADRFALPGQLDGVACGLFFGGSTGGMFESEVYLGSLALPGRGARIAGLASLQPSGPGEAVARRHSVTGPVETIASACASATLALGAALDALRAAEIDVAITGGSDSLCQLTYAGFNSLRAVDERPCRPFRSGRLGMSLGEGAGVLVLERQEHAERRGARILGGLAGAGGSCDAHHMTSPDPAGDGIARAVEAALADAGTGADAIDFVNLHGTGTQANDDAEARMLKRVFGARAASLPATSTKAAVGHYLGAAGAVEAVVTQLGLLRGEVHPTPGGEAPDADLGVDLVIGAPRRLPDARRALSTNLAFGGANGAVVLVHPEAL